MPNSDTQHLKTNHDYKNEVQKKKTKTEVHGRNGKKELTMICENILQVKTATKRFIQ